MITPEAFSNALSHSGVDFVTGVPDSLLKNFCAYIADTIKPHKHVIAANEGNAVALAAGYHLATGKIGLVYLQNSGIGNCVNPLISLADPAVYSIPMLLLIGWRGEPGVHDEPQHVRQGEITLGLLTTMGVACETLPQSEDDVKKVITDAVSYMRKENAPYALVVKKDTFAPYTAKQTTPQPTLAQMLREEAIACIIGELDGNEAVVATTGKASRELFELRTARQAGHDRDFLTVGSMGHASSIALGIALASPGRPVYCLDGDGALIMHMGSLAIIGNAAPKNFKHIVLNNCAHESVGGQPTAAFSMNVTALARSCGYTATFRAANVSELKEALNNMKQTDGPAFLEVVIRQGSRENLGRPTATPLENKKHFMRFLSL